MGFSTKLHRAHWVASAVSVSLPSYTVHPSNVSQGGYSAANVHVRTQRPFVRGSCLNCELGYGVLDQAASRALGSISCKRVLAFLHRPPIQCVAGRLQCRLCACADSATFRAWLLPE